MLPFGGYMSRLVFGFVVSFIFDTVVLVSCFFHVSG